MSLTLDYLKYHEEYTSKYGNKTVVLIQVGSFFECYSTNERGPDLFPISQLLNLILTRKDKSNNTIDEKNPKMMGFPTISLQKNLKVLVDNNYTVVLIEQITNPPNPKREITGIYSPSTYIEEVSQENNYLLSIYLLEEKQMNGKKLTCVGLSAIDLNIGKVVIEEYHSSIVDPSSSIIKLKETFSKLNPREVILFCEDKELRLTFEGSIDLYKYSYRFLETLDKNFFKIAYQSEFFKKIYGDHGMVSILEYLDLEMKGYATISLMIGMDFCYKQNEKLLKNLKKPISLEGDTLFLGNNTIYNLNLISDDRKSSLFGILDNTSTLMGRRLLKERLLNPETNIKTLEKRYSQIEKFLEGDGDIYQVVDSFLRNIRDIERYSRRVIIKSLHPFELNNLYLSLQNSKKLFEFLLEKNFKELEGINSELIDRCQKFLEWIEERFQIEALTKSTLKEIITNFYKRGCHREIDEICNKAVIGGDLVDDLIKTLNGICKEDLKFTVKNNKKEGQYLLLTKKRGDKLENILKHWEDIEIKTGVNIHRDELDFSSTKTSVKIKVPQLGENHTDANVLQAMLSNKLRTFYLKDLEEIGNKFLELFESVIVLISEIDVICSNAITSKKYNYSKPSISSSDSSFVTFTDLRHPIIERIIDYEYIPQSLSIGKDLKGVLLYGLNSSGKSSFQKSVGLALIMAQAGMFVSAKNFEYFPYKYLFTRIDGNDNIFKGLSSFTLEMMDLKNILKYRGVNTLVIGDEVCKGTEYLSANAILASTIINLSNSQTSFIFATHLHDIPKLDKIKELDNVKCYHLEVRHNLENNELIFERLLKEGQGEEIYGILVANNIIRDVEFNDLTNEIKTDLMKVPNNLLSTKNSRYNSKVFIDECGLCGKRISDGEYDVHHINFQKNCKDGFVNDKGHLRMNSQANLIVLCEDCHIKIHKGDGEIEGYKQTSNGKKVIKKVVKKIIKKVD